MTRITAEIKIDAPTEQVWEVLRDFGGGYVWNPGVRYSEATTAHNVGEGAMRYCDMRNGDRIVERAFDWREGEGYKHSRTRQSSRTPEINAVLTHEFCRR